MIHISFDVNTCFECPFYLKDNQYIACDYENGFELAKPDWVVVKKAVIHPITQEVTEAVSVRKPVALGRERNGDVWNGEIPFECPFREKQRVERQKEERDRCR